MKQHLLRVARRAGLLPALEELRAGVHQIRAFSENRAFLRDNPGFAAPPADLMQDAYGHSRLRSYSEKGAKAAETLCRLVMPHIKPDSICEWGCGPARVVRHLPALLGCRVFGTDYNARTVEWCKSNVSAVEFRLNGLAPPLPFADAELDVVYAISVFTHLSAAMHVAWMAELERVVRPGGLIVLTVHGDRSAQGRLLTAERAAYDSGALVVRGNVLEGSRVFVAYHSPQFMRAMLHRVQLLQHETASGLAGIQDVYVVRR